MFLTPYRVGQFKTSFIFSSSILISSSPTSFTFHLHFSSFTYRSFSTNHFTTSSTISSYLFSISVFIIILSIKLATFLVLIRSRKSLFIMVQNVASELVSSKNITIGSNNPSDVVNATFHSSPSFMYILQPYLKSIFVNTFLLPMFSTISNIKGNR